VLKHIKAREDWNEKSLSTKGFTLIELLVVIVILGILAAVVVFAVGGINNKGQDAACKAEANTVRTAAEAYFANVDPGVYPSAVGDMVPKYLSKTPTLVAYASGSPYALTWVATGPCSVANDGNP